MRYIVAFVVSLVFLATARQIFANTSVTISNNGDGSDSSVNVQNNVNISNSSSTQSTNHTHVQITQNGETKTFDTNGDESVNWSSDDGSSKVSINGQQTNVSVKPTTTTRPTPTTTITPTPTPTEHSTSVHPSSNHFSFQSFFNHYFGWLKSFFGK